jgi:hypothetical protein
LTSVFREINPGGILDKYYNFISSKDYELVSKKVLDDIEYNIEDLLIRMAPYVSRAASEEGRYISPYIKTRNKKGETIYKKWDSYSRRYSEISTFPDKDLTSLDDSKITEEQKANYHDH